MKQSQMQRKWLLASLIASGSLVGCQANIVNWVVGQLPGFPTGTQSSPSSPVPSLETNSSVNSGSTSNSNPGSQYPSEIRIKPNPNSDPVASPTSQKVSQSETGAGSDSSDIVGDIMCPCGGGEIDQASSSPEAPVTELSNDNPTSAASPVNSNQKIVLQESKLNLSPYKIATPETAVHKGYGYPSALLKPKPQGESYLAWADQDWNGHITQLDAQDRKIGQDIVITNRAVLALYAHQDSFAVLLSEPVFNEGYTDSSTQSLEIVKYTNSGSKVFESTLIANADIRDTEATILDDWGNYQLEWSGQHYAAYVATSHNFGTRDKQDIHQGDALFIVTGEGNLLKPEYRSEYVNDGYQSYGYGGWTWNVSHSFEQRLVTNGRFFAMLAKGDAYPRGMALNLQADPVNATVAEALMLHPEKPNLFAIKGEIGLNYTPIALGDMVLLDDALWISFSTSEDRESYDVGLMKVNWKGQIETMKWLTQTPGIEEHSVKMARYGKGLAIGWNSFTYPTDQECKDYSYHDCCEETLLGILDGSGNWQIKPEFHDVKFNFNDVIHEKKQIHAHTENYERFNGGQFVTYPDGHVAWAESITNPQEVVIHRIH